MLAHIGEWRKRRRHRTSETEPVGGSLQAGEVERVTAQPTADQLAAQRKFGKEHSSDTEGDGPSGSSESFFVNGIELRNRASHRTWMDFYNKNMQYRGRPLFTCVLGFDKHNVIDQMVKEETARFIGLRNQASARNNLGAALAVMSRGTKRWQEVNFREDNQEGYTADGHVRQGQTPSEPYCRFTLFYQIADLFIFTEMLNRDPDKDGPVDVWRYDGMDYNMVCISGDRRRSPAVGLATDSLR